MARPEARGARPHFGPSFFQSVDYLHNIRCWLTNINNSSLSNDGVTNNDVNDLFGMDLVYEGNFNGLNTPKYNGSITTTNGRPTTAARVPLGSRGPIKDGNPWRVAVLWVE